MGSRRPTRRALPPIHRDHRVVTIQADRIAVRFDRRCHNPILREAALDRDPTPIPWLGERSIGFTYH